MYYMHTHSHIYICVCACVYAYSNVNHTVYQCGWVCCYLWLIFCNWYPELSGKESDVNYSCLLLCVIGLRSRKLQKSWHNFAAKYSNLLLGIICCGKFVTQCRINFVNSLSVTMCSKVISVATGYHLFCYYRLAAIFCQYSIIRLVVCTNELL